MISVIGRRQQHRFLSLICLMAGLMVGLPSDADADKLWRGDRLAPDTLTSPNIVHRHCLTPEGNDRRLGRTSDGRWMLPKTALAADFDTTLHCLVLRFNFQYETTDDPNTTGRGSMDMSRPLDTLTDEEYIARVGHLTDPPPHDSLYFDAHLQALSRYWETISGGKVHLTWDIYPPARDSVYELPYPMSHYGRCDFSDVVTGLEYYFVDGLRLADTTSPEIDFSNYGAIFLFHAGSDRQSDIGFPVTCSDLFSGYIKFGGEVAVDDSTYFICDGLMMPETNVQDNRATALNAVMAHEFGHQLGLVDMYSTENFFSQLGDFALMDNNGFGTGIDFGWPVGRVFGAIPLYPCAWSRAFLGMDEVHDFRRDTSDVMITAAELRQDPGIKIARIPITENEYYLAEVRLEEVDNHTTYVLADQTTSVIQGPVDSTRSFTGEYDFLMPGSGMLIYHVDEEVAGLDYVGNGRNNFLNNTLQWYRNERKFVRLVEADGLVHFGGDYYAGFGSQGDFFRDDLKTLLTPNSNPNTFDNSGNNSHIFIDNIHRLEVDSIGGRNDHYMLFDLEIDRKVNGFPVRAGVPWMGLAPIADDLDGDGTPELIAATGQVLSVVTSAGDDFIRTKSSCDTCPIYYDTAVTSINRGIDINPAATYPVPVYALAPSPITAGPVTGRYDATDTERLVAVGHRDELFNNWSVALYEPRDLDNDAEADLRVSLLISSQPLGLSFGDSILYCVATGGDSINSPKVVYRWSLPNATPQVVTWEDSSLYYGHSRIGDDLVVLTSNTITGENDYSTLHIVSDTVYTYDLDKLYIWGPVTADINLDGQPEIVLFTPEGDGLLLTVDTTGAETTFSILNQRAIGRLITTAPVIGDVDLDGRPDIIVGGVNELLAFNADLIFKTDFPREVDERFLEVGVIAPPVVADIERGGVPEIIFPTAVGNFYSYGSELSYGFPLSSGEQRWPGSSSSAVVFDDSTGSKLAFLGGDGWMYAWEVEPGMQASFWPMNGGGPEGKFTFESERLPTIAEPSTVFDDSRFYNYPNPVRGDQTCIRYYLGADASSVELKIFDLSGVEIEHLNGTTHGGADHEVLWYCSNVTTGVYRCVISVDFGGDTETAFTDIAIVR